MAISVDTQDLINYPGNVKRVSIDQVSVVPQGAEGDEKYVSKFATTAYSDIENRTAIQDIYTTSFKIGWCKSSGFAGNDGKFDLASGAKTIKVKLDSTTGGDGNGYYPITLDYNTDLSPMSGEVVAADMEVEIRATASGLDTADVGYTAAYRNCSVEFIDGKFWILSGTTGEFYTGNNKSAVDVKAGDSNNAATILGFDLKTSSSSLAGVAINEALVTTEVTISGVGMTINSNTGAVAGDCMMITDRNNTDYFQLLSDPTDGVGLSCESTAIKHHYDTGEAKVQLLKEQDPDAEPTMWLDTIDKINRHGVKCIINEIDYSS